MKKSRPTPRRPRIGGVHHLAVVVRDLARAERFYRRLFSFAVVRRWNDERGRPRSVWLALDARVFLAVERAGPKGPRRADLAPGWHCVALAIDRRERDVWRRRLERAGVAIERETAYTLFVRDPDGNLLGLTHYPVVAS
jgi:glyoxylase I family protein